MKRRETRLARIRAAREALEAEAAATAKAQAKAKQKARAELEEEAARAGRRVTGPKPKVSEKTEPDQKAQRNFTDPDSRIMRSGMGEWIQGYNGQAAVDSDHQVIVACDLTNQGDDTPHLQPLFCQIQHNTGHIPTELSADAGYFSAANVEAVLATPCQPLLPPDRMGLHGTDAQTQARIDNALNKVADPQQVCSEHMTIADWMRIALSTDEGANAYAQRKKTVEPVFGQIKGCPGSPGFHQFLRRGLNKARQEWCWVCATHNFKKYLRQKRIAMTPT